MDTNFTSVIQKWQEAVDRTFQKAVAVMPGFLVPLAISIIKVFCYNWFADFKTRLLITQTSENWRTS